MQNPSGEDEDDEILLFNLVYCSRAVKTLQPAELDRLVSSAQQRNAKGGITGWLVYSHGIFFQWLEGSRDSVKRLMGSICADPRHNTIVVISEEEEIRSRLFSHWDMELVSADDIQAVLLDSIQASNDSKSTAALKSLLTELDSFTSTSS